MRPLLIGSGLASAATCGALAIYVAPAGSALATTKMQASAGLASAADGLETYWDAISGSSAREEDRSAMRDLSASLAQVTIRLDKIEREDQAGLDELRAHTDQESSSKFADITARLDKLEQKAVAPPAAPAPEFADVVARLDRLEKKAALPAAPAPQFADIAARLDKLEKRAAVASTPSPEVAESAPRLDTGEKKAAVQVASAAKPLPPAPKRTMVWARGEPSAPSGRAGPDDAKPLLRDYSVEDVRDGVALVDSRYGSRQVAPGDIIPGAGRVLRIDRQGGNWFVLTSLGIILGGPAPR
ncbi:MAG TPA: hypothetical protein VF886_18090 [Roseiarcus sp.]